MTQALEQLLGNTRNYTGLETHATIDTYAAGTTALYSFEAPEVNQQTINPFPVIEPIRGIGSPGGIIQKPDYLEGGIERCRQPENNHDGSDGTHMNYETLIPGVKKPIINIHIPMDNEY